MFNSILGIFKDVAETVAAPVEIVADLTRAVTKPIAEAAKDCAEQVKEAVGVDDK